MRALLWGGKSSRVAVGYRFDTPGRWAEPDETLEQEREYGDIAVFSRNPVLETHFANKSGVDCGKDLVKFVRVPVAAAPGYLGYLVDNSNLDNLLRTIGHCATE
jgi:hypothetical protein